MNRRAFMAIFKMEFLLNIQFRMAALGRVATSIFWGIASVVVLIAFYTYGSGTSSELTLSQAISYVYLAQSYQFFLPSHMSVCADIVSKTRNGDVGVELLRPFHLYAYWVTKAMSARIALFLLFGLPVAVIAAFFPEGYAMTPPASAYSMFACLCLVLGSILLTSACNGLAFALMLKIEWGTGPLTMLTTIIDILTGFYLPLQLFPDSMQGFLYAQPFSGIVDYPFRFYVGAASPDALPGMLLSQLAWTAVIGFAGFLLMRRMLKRVSVQGG